MQPTVNAEALLSSFRRYVELSDEDEQVITQLVTPRHFSKGQFVGRPGDVDRYTNFIINGSARVFYIDDNGHEHNLQLGINNWWLSDYVFFTTQEPAALYIEALEKTEVLSFTFEHIQELYERVPKTERFFRLLVEKAYASFQKRVLSNLSSDAEHRYLEFKRRYPEMDLKISQKHIASYLGMSAEFLSKIKKRIVQKERLAHRAS